MSQPTTNANSIKSNPTNSAETIGNNEDISSELLFHLPVKSLINFRKVSKQWHSIILNPHFVLSYNRFHPPSLSGLFLVPKHQNEGENSQIEYFSLGQKQSNTTVFPLLHLGSIRILQSCNGLLLYFKGKKHYVLNPTTQEKKLLPSCLDTIYPTSPSYYSLVYDPSVSLHYKIIGLTETSHSNKYKISIYSSESNLWISSKAPEFFAPHDIDFTSVIFCNGSVHWTKRTIRGLYFDVEKEMLNHMPESPRLEQYSCEYFGHSRGYLNCVFTMEGLHYYEIFELEKDYSAWIFKSKIELNVLALQYPKMAMKIDAQHPQFMYQCHVLSVIRGHNGEAVEIIMSIPGEVIAYDCIKKTSWHICKSRESEKEKEIWYGIYQVYEYFESISPVLFSST